MEMQMQKKLKSNNNVVNTEVDYFESLPVDLVSDILDMANDAKVLCKCTILSKKFASLVYKMKSVRLTLPEIDWDTFELYCNFLDVNYEVHYFKDDESTWPIKSSSIQKMVKMIAFLRKFKELESLDIDSACPITPCTSPYLKWKARMDKHEPFVTGLVSINPTSMCKLNEDGTVQFERKVKILFSDHDVYRSLDDCFYSLISCTEWLFMIFSVVKSHDSLRRVTCSDTHRHGRFVFEAEQIAQWREKLLRDDREALNENVRAESGVGYKKELDLRVAGGYLIKKVHFMFMDCPLDTADVDLEFENMPNWEYGEDEKVLGAAVKRIIEGIARGEVD